MNIKTSRLSIILLLLCVITLFAACGSSADITNEETETQVAREVTTEATVAETETEVPEEIKASVFISSSELNVRAGAGTSYDVVTSVNSGDKLVLTGNEQLTSSGSKWLEIELPDSDGTGWVSAKYGSVEENASGNDNFEIAQAETAEKTETDVTEEVTEEDEKKKKSDSGIRPEFKEAMDSYEEFFDEYIAFMEKYASSSNPLGMMSDYLDYMNQYADAMEKLEKIESEDMSVEEEKYYLDVLNRINKKLLDVSY